MTRHAARQVKDEKALYKTTEKTNRFGNKSAGNLGNQQFMDISEQVRRAPYCKTPPQYGSPTPPQKVFAELLLKVNFSEKVRY